MRKCASALLMALTVLYPLGVYFALGHVQPLWLALLLAILAGSRALLTRQHFWWVVACGAGALAALSWVQGSVFAVKLYPVLVSVVLLCVFACSLRWPPTVVERLARLQEPDLPPQAVRYTAQVTQVWCLFFVGNAAVSLYTACFASDAAWALYNGLLSYALMGVLMACEWCVRQRMRRRHAAPDVVPLK